MKSFNCRSVFISALFFFLVSQALWAQDLACTVPHAGSTAVAFEYNSPQSQEVFLAGEMSNWEGDALPMVKGDDGIWRLTIYLEEGIWAYKFVTDGEWIPDPANSILSDDGYGGQNSILSLAPKGSSAAPLLPSQLGTVKEVSIKSEFRGDQKIVIYRPAGTDPHANLPWVLLLHGYGMDRNQWTRDAHIVDLMDRLIASGKCQPFALLMVDGGGSFYQAEVEKYLMKEIVPRANTWGLSTDTHQRAVAGISMGGFGALYLATRYPETFGTCVPISAAFNYRSVNFEASIAAKIPNLHLYCGTEDAQIIKGNRDLETLWKKTGFKGDFHYSLGGHTWRYWNSILPEIMINLGKDLNKPKI